MKMSIFTPRYSIAIERTELTAPLIDRLISFDNFEPQWVQEPIGKIFDIAFQRGDYDICELSLARCIIAHSCNTLFYQPLYIFPNRRFRHDIIYVAEGSGLRFAEELRGRRIGITKLTQTAVITARGVLADQYGLGPHQAHWFVGPMNDAAGEGIVLPDTPPHIRISSLRGSRSLTDLLMAGELDAVIGLERPTPCPGHGTGKIKPLFDESALEEKAYFRRFGVFPIMHTLCLNRSVLKYVREERERLISHLTGAFDRSTASAIAAFRSGEHRDSPVPAWMLNHRADGQHGTVLYPYPVGLEANQNALGSLIRWMADQGLIDAPFSIEQMFD